MYKLSIITINYNNLEGLKRTVESVLNQTWQEFEYIVIDGGSTDGSLDYLKENSDAFTYWVSEPDKGIYNAMNKGIAKATGEYLLFLNSGDVFYNDNVLLQTKMTLLLNKDIVYGDLWIIGEQGRGFRNRYPDCIDFPFLKQTSLGHPSTFIKRTLFNSFGFYRTDLKIVSDWAFFIKVFFEHKVSYCKVDLIIATFYVGGFSTSRVNHQQHIEERKKVLLEMFEVYDASFDECIIKLEQQKKLVDQLDLDIEILVTNKRLLKILNSIIRVFGFVLKKKGLDFLVLHFIQLIIFMTISAIIPCFNAATTIERAILSVVFQTIPVSEIIVVNDGSTDDSGRVLERLKSNYSQLKVIHQENKGVSYTRNIAIQEALGDYILTLDADDYFENSFVEKALNKFTENVNYGAIMCGYVRIVEGKKIKPYIPPMVSLASCLVGNGALACLLFKKEVIIKAGLYDTNFVKGYEDWDLNIRILKLGYTFGVVKEVLFNYSDIKGSRTTNATKNDLDLKLQLYDKYKDDYIDNARNIFKELMQQNNKLRQEKQKLLDSISFKIGHRIVLSLGYVLNIFKSKSA